MPAAAAAHPATAATADASSAAAAAAAETAAATVAASGAADAASPAARGGAAIPAAGDRWRGRSIEGHRPLAHVRALPAVRLGVGGDALERLRLQLQLRRRVQRGRQPGAAARG